MQHRHGKEGGREGGEGEGGGHSHRCRKLSMFLFRLNDCESQSETRAAMASCRDGGEEMVRRTTGLASRGTHQ